MVGGHETPPNDVHQRVPNNTRLMSYFIYLEGGGDFERLKRQSLGLVQILTNSQSAGFERSGGRRSSRNNHHDNKTENRRPQTNNDLRLGWRRRRAPAGRLLSGVAQASGEAAPGNHCHGGGGAPCRSQAQKDPLKHNPQE